MTTYTQVQEAIKNAERLADDYMKQTTLTKELTTLPLRHAVSQVGMMREVSNKILEIIENEKLPPQHLQEAYFMMIYDFCLELFHTAFVVKMENGAPKDSPVIEHIIDMFKDSLLKKIKEYKA